MSIALSCVCSFVRFCVSPPSGSASGLAKLQLQSLLTNPIFCRNVNNSQELGAGDRVASIKDRRPHKLVSEVKVGIFPMRRTMGLHWKNDCSERVLKKKKKRTKNFL